MESITLQMLELQLENYKKLDVQKKMDIAANIFERIDATSFTYDPELSFMDKVSNLTGVNTSVLEEIRALEDVSRKFKDWAMEVDISGGMNVLYATMKKFLHDLYTNDKQIPTKSALQSTFKNRYKDDFQANFNKFFTTIPVPGTQHSIIVEKPEIVVRRHQYLQKKAELVNAGKVFVYIEDACYFGRYKTLKMCRPQNNKSMRMVLAVSPQLGFLSSIYCNRSIEVTLRNWLDEKVITNVPVGCVFVFENSLFEHIFDTPQSHTAKHEMIEWLQQNDIPHNPDMHRAELYALVETYKKTNRHVTKAEQILKLSGHTVLCREEGVVFEYFQPFWKKLKEIIESRRGLTIVAKTSKKEIPFVADRIVTQIQKEYWHELGKKLLDVETSAHRKDQEIEETIDKLMTYVASDKFSPGETEFDDYCEALCQEYIFR